MFWLTTIKDEIPPAAQTRDSSPRPVALEGEVKVHLGASWAQRLGRVEKGFRENPTPSSPPCPNSLCNLGEFSSLPLQGR